MSEDYDWSAEIAKLQIRIRGGTGRVFQAGFGSAAMILLPFHLTRAPFGSQLGVSTPNCLAYEAGAALPPWEEMRPGLG